MIKSHGSAVPQISDREQPVPRSDLILAHGNAGLVTGSGTAIKFKWLFLFLSSQISQVNATLEKHTPLSLKTKSPSVGLTFLHTSSLEAEPRGTEMPGFRQSDLNKCTINLFFLKSSMYRQCSPPFLPHLPCLGPSLLPYLQRAVLTFSRYAHEVTQRLFG